MKKEKIDSLIEETLKNRVSCISMTSNLEQRIKQEIHGENKEDLKMGRFSKKKVLVLAAVMCLAGSIVAIGAGKITGYISSTYNNRPDITSYENIEIAEKKLGCPINTVDQFVNGYQFDRGYLLDVQGVDNEQHVLATYPEAILEYKKGNLMASLTIQNAQNVTEESEGKHEVKIPYGNIDIAFNNDHYKFVPEDYQITKTEQAAIDAGELSISYGTDKIELSEFNSVSWNQEGAHYLLYTMGDDVLSQAELLAMAKEIIDKK